MPRFPRSLRRHPWVAFYMTVAACTGPTPSGDDVLLELEVDDAGEVLLADARLVPPGSVPRADAPHPDGELRVEVLSGDVVTWTGSQYLPWVTVAEDFGGTSIQGERVPTPSATELFAFPDDGREQVPIRVTVVPADGGEPVVSELEVEVPRPENAEGTSGSLVIIDDDVAGRREGICTALFDDCDEPEEFCRSFIGSCREEACLADDTWDGEEVELRGGGGVHVLLLPVEWGDPDSFEASAEETLNELYTNNEWYRDHPDGVRFTIWRQACSYQSDAPDPDDRMDVLNWLRGGEGWDGLRDWTVQLPDFDKIVAYSDSTACSGVAELGGRNVALIPCADAGDTADVLAHELGHSIAHLSDEYEYGADELRDCGDRDRVFQRPNLSQADSPSWFCEADTGEVYAGQVCGGLSEGVVGSVVGPNARCSNDVTVPCGNSIMRWHIDNQFDPVGYGAMTYANDNDGSRMGYESCGSCDDSCDAFATGSDTCGLNGCNQICNSCDTGKRCVGTGLDTFTCRDGCMGPEASCRSGLGFEFCHDETAVTSDPACPDYGLRFSTCDNGTEIEGDCISP
ncbi:MAG TPA: hypothetical protein RMH99_04660 [Sandaracinaceae bacterium LLY-WYZ-13_1]|nr:hypothetical protein [Sandaracinaceae bacterium LLY-WYZ-13_1]